MDISVPLRYVPPGMDQFIIGWMQCIDSSEEIIKMSYGDKEPVGVEVGEGATSDGGNIYNPAENGMTVYSADEMFRDEQGMKRNNPLSPSNFDTFEAYERAINNTPEMKKNASATRIKLFKGGS